MEEVLQFRQECYFKCGWDGQLRVGRRPRPEDDPMQPAQKQSRKSDSAAETEALAGSVRIEGRSEDKKSASINGIYGPLPFGFDGRDAYEKHQSGEKERYLYFHAAKSCWKISNRLGD